MSMRINKECYLKLIKEDIEWLLKNTERDLERDHIIAIIQDSIKREYPKEEYCDEEFIKWWEETIGVWDWKKYKIPSDIDYEQIYTHQVIDGKPCNVCSHMHCLTNGMKCVV